MVSVHRSNQDELDSSLLLLWGRGVPLPFVDAFARRMSSTTQPACGRLGVEPRSASTSVSK